MMLALQGAIWLGAVGTGLPERALPRPLLFFTQVAELFPNAALDSIEWRVRDDHVLMTGPATFEYEGRFDPALFASVA